MKETQALIERVRRVNDTHQHLHITVDTSLGGIKPGQSLLAYSVLYSDLESARRQYPDFVDAYLSSDRRLVSPASTSAAVTSADRLRIASRAPRGSWPCTASRRRTTSSAVVARGPLRSWAASRAA